jgi:hypothetical protein
MGLLLWALSLLHYGGCPGYSCCYHIYIVAAIGVGIDASHGRDKEQDGVSSYSIMVAMAQELESGEGLRGGLSLWDGREPTEGAGRSSQAGNDSGQECGVGDRCSMISVIYYG